MFKFTIFLWIGFIAWNLHISLAEPQNSDGSKHALQDTPTFSSPLNGMEQLMKLLGRMEIQLENIASSVRRIPEGFKQIGSRFFHIGSIGNYVTFNTANANCRQMGGHLASIQSQEEFDNIVKDSEVELHVDYWLATNDQAVEGHYVSIVSNKTAPFLKWKVGEPSDKDHTKNCVAVSKNYGGMYDADCNEINKYICQADLL